jgi:hypothetical protein
VNDVFDTPRAFFFKAVFIEVPESFENLVGLTSECPRGADIDDYRLTQVREKIAEWGERWNLTDEWCREAALNVVLSLRRYGQWRAPLGVEQLEGLRGLLPDRIFSSKPVRSSTAKLFRFEQPGWDVPLRIRGDFETEVRNRFERSLREYCDQVVAEARSQGLVEVEEKRNPDQYFWLAQFQVSRKSPADIWRSLPQGDSRTRRAIERGIRQTARELELTLRET